MNQHNKANESIANTPSRITGSITIKDIATQLGISHSTVSRALNDHKDVSDDTRQSVRKVAQQLGYVANEGARSLRQSSNRVIGVLVPDIGSDLFAVLAKTLASHCNDESYQLILCATNDDPKTELRHAEMLRRYRAKGIVIVPSSRLLPEVANLLAAVPTVQFSRRSSLINAPCVSLNGTLGVRSAVRHLVELGHRRVAFIGLSSTVSTGASRVQAFSDAAQDHGLELPAQFISLGFNKSEFSRSTTIALVRSELPPTAIIYGSADLTLGGLEAVRREGLLLPRDLSVIGFGDPHWLRIFDPGVSTISLNVAESAEIASSILLHHIHGETSLVDQVSQELESNLIVRGTTGPPRCRGG